MPARLPLYGLILLASTTLAESALADEPKAPSQPGTVIAIGGGRVPDSVLRRFVELGGGTQGRLVVVPTAGGDTGLPAAETVATTWTARGFGHVTLLHTRDPQQVDDEFLAPLKTATALWFDGGQQTRIADAYVGTKFEATLDDLLARDGVVAGTSAGAAIQSRVMIASGNTTPTLGRGLDLIPHAIVDQHFLQRNRLNRSLAAVAKHPERIGIGIDEGTAIVIRGRHVEVLGDSFVTVIESARDDRPLSIRTFRSGGRFALPTGDPASNAAETPRKRWAIALHGGAGTLPDDAPAELVAAHRNGLKRALETGRDLLADGGTSLDAVEAVIRVLEDDPLFNAGHGAVFNAAGGHELDASIMDGRTLDGGAVAGVTTVKNPISLARRVMTDTRHVLLGGAGAEAFATETQVDRVENGEFSTDARREQWERVRKAEAENGTSRFDPPRAWQYGTVGCVALDTAGHLAAGTSTGGLTNKKFGRIGDSPILSAGTYADDETCGVSGTGIGEQFIRHAVAAQISLLMRHRDWSVKRSAEYVLRERLRKGDGGIIAVDRNGEIVWVFNTPGMFRAAADSAGRFDVRIRDEE